MTAPAERPRLRLLSFKPIRKNALRGFVTVELPIGLTIVDCPVLIGANGRSWVALPAKPVLDAEGRHVKPDGKPQYAALLTWRDRSRSDRFSAKVLELIRERHPGALREDEP